MYNNKNNSSFGIAGIFDKQSPLALHRAFKFTWYTPRTAFLSLLRLNMWGMATIFSKKAFFVDQKTTDASKSGEYWWDFQAKLRNFWWNGGGSWDSLVSAINAGKGKKFLGIRLAPGKIKNALKAKGISGVNEKIGIGSLESVLIAAGVIIVPLTPLIILIINSINKKDESAAVETFTANNDDGGDGDGDGMKAGAGLIGVAALAALYFGTQNKAKQKK